MRKQRNNSSQDGEFWKTHHSVEASSVLHFVALNLLLLILSQLNLLLSTFLEQLALDVILPTVFIVEAGYHLLLDEEIFVEDLLCAFLWNTELKVTISSDTNQKLY